MGNEIWLAVRWWVALFVLGLASYPLTRYLFRNWWDKGYLFAKAVGLVIVTYIVWLCASLHILPFTSLSVYIVMLTVLILGIALRRLNHESEIWDLGIDSELMKKFGLFILEELFFFGALYFWA
jgi:uncharacterized membrane protein